MVPLPIGSSTPFTASAAVAVPADPVKKTDPNDVSPIENEIDPDGVVPFVEVTVAIKYTTSLAETVLRLASSVKCVFVVVVVGGGVVLSPFHPITSW
jgi:hypothetical protein